MNMATSKKLLNDLSFCVFDLETTGGNHNYDKIIEIGIVKIENLKIVDELNHLIKPEIAIPPFIQKLTGWTEEDVKNCPTIEEVIDDIVRFMGDSILVAHNSSFDVPFLNSVLTRLNRPITLNKVICTDLMTKYLIPNIINSNLTFMSQIFDIPHAKAHHALEDARATSQLLLHYLNFFIKKKLKKVNQLYYPRNKFELDRVHYKQSDDLETIINAIKKNKSPLVVIMKGNDGVIENMIPTTCSKSQVEYIEKLLKTTKWITTTLIMQGSMLEALISLSQNYSKIKKEIQQNILQYLTDFKIIKKNPKADTEQLSFTTIDDFLITRHLVPGQFVLYPLFNFGTRKKIIFTYPGHKKKLYQHIKTLTNNFNAGKKQTRNNIHQDLRIIIYNYIKETVSKSQNEMITFSMESFLKNHESIFKNIQSFSKTKQNPYNYPIKHI